MHKLWDSQYVSNFHFGWPWALPSIVPGTPNFLIIFLPSLLSLFCQLVASFRTCSSITKWLQSLLPRPFSKVWWRALRITSLLEQPDFSSYSETHQPSLSSLAQPLGIFDKYLWSINSLPRIWIQWWAKTKVLSCRQYGWVRRKTSITRLY